MRGGGGEIEIQHYIVHVYALRFSANLSFSMALPPLDTVKMPVARLHAQQIPTPLTHLPCCPPLLSAAAGPAPVTELPATAAAAAGQWQGRPSLGAGAGLFSLLPCPVVLWWVSATW